MGKHFEHIHCDPGILGGKPVVRGTRLSVEFILELAASGASKSEIAAAYPELLSEEAVEEAFLYAARQTRAPRPRRIAVA